MVHAIGLLLLLATAGAAHVVSIAAPIARPRCNAGDRAALLAVKAAFKNASYFQSWTADFACCHWYGVDCGGDDYDYDPSDNDRVLSLAIIRDDNITGAIPGDAIARLTSLQELIFFKVPGVTGPIPEALAKISGLKDLTISRTAVSGPVPRFIGDKLTELLSLDLSFNSLTGTIPPNLANSPKLTGIDLSRNHLTGTIPPLLFSKAGLNHTAFLKLSHNNLTGTIPAEFGSVNFTEIDLSRNQLTGDASMLFVEGKGELVGVYLSRNALSFDMSKLQLPDQLGYLDVSHNMIYGTVPAQAAQMEQLNVSYSRLCGELPTGGNMATFDVYCFQHNKCLCGAPLAPCSRPLI